MKKLSFMTLLVLGAASAVQAGELVVTPASSEAKSGMYEVALDLATDGDVSGFNFLLKLPELKEGAVDTSKCLAQLPKGWSGACNHTKDGVYFFAMANGSETLQAGIAPLGSVLVPTLAKSGGVSVEHLVLADVNGDAIQSRAEIAQ